MKNKNTFCLILIITVFVLITLFSWFKPDGVYTESERRALAQKPELNVQTLLSGRFMTEFENYKVDQFPLREKLRSLKALFSKYVFAKKDNNGLFSADGHISKIEYPQNQEMINNAKTRFDYIYKKYLKDKDVNIYLSLIPDKNAFFAKENGYLTIDYNKFTDDFKSKMDYMTYIDVTDFLSLDDYYTTDSHWRQEKITDIAKHICENMGSFTECEYEMLTLDNSFYGVYYGQSALPFKPDTIRYLTNDILSDATVTYYDTGVGVEGELYNVEKAYGKDPYEMFLSGSTPFVTIENSHSQNDKELVVFRDSYGSSLVPLLVPSYKKITVVDIRYMMSDFVGNFVKFDNQDVLFLYSTSLINNSLALR